MPVRAFFNFVALILFVSPTQPRLAAAQIVESHDQAVFMCPSSDIQTPGEIRRTIDRSVDHAVAYPSNYTRTAELIGKEYLPRLLIAGDRTHDLRSLAGQLPIETSADLVTTFHSALVMKNAALMRGVASSNVRRTRTQAPFLAPTAALPDLASVYVKLFERSPDLSTAYRRLGASALAEADRVRPAPAGMREEGPQDRRRLALAWMLIHLERIRLQLPEAGSGDGQSRPLLERAARLVSRECQPRTWHLIRSLRSDRPVCADREGAGRLLRSDHPYVCKLTEIMEQEK